MEFDSITIKKIFHAPIISVYNSAIVIHMLA